MAESATPGTPIWVDLASSDLDTSKAFYTELFGWEFEAGDPAFMGYTNATSLGKRVAGLGPNMGAQQGQPDAWSVYLATDDAAETTRNVTAAGGAVLAEPMPIGDFGTMAVVVDPAGSTFGVWQSGTHTGFEVDPERDPEATKAAIAAGTVLPVHPVWFENYTRDWAAASAFYPAVFGASWTLVGDTDDFRYATLTLDGAEVAGQMDGSRFLPPGVPSHWGVYFSVPDTTAAFDKALTLGAKPIQVPEDSPYGRIAALFDPTGAEFKLHQVI